MTVASVGVGGGASSRDTTRRTRRFREMGLAYLLLAPALLVIRRLHLLSVPPQLQADALRDAARARDFPRTTWGCTRSSPP
jgi:hypothetical protein